MRPREFRAYCAVALAGLGHLPTTIATRAITVPMRRRAPDEYVRPYRERVTRPEGDELRRRLAAWVQRHGDTIPEAPDLPAGVTDRPADCWERPVAIGDAAGGRWPATARAACIALVSAAGEDHTPGVRLLADLRAAFGADARLATATLLDRLTALDEAPWGDRLDGKSDKAPGCLARRKAPPVRHHPAHSAAREVDPKGVRGGGLHRYLAALPAPPSPERNTRHKRNAPGRDVASVASVALWRVPRARHHFPR
jgi:Protein of unknown function (DUF3631)